MKTLTGILSRMGIILVVVYFALFSLAGQVAAVRVVEATATKVNYPLPYPGILPDSPLYFFKVARDWVMTQLIFDQTQKSFYLLFLADKRIAAGQSLIKSGKVALGRTTLEKAEDYFGQSIGLATKTKNKDLLAKLTVAGAKHSEILATVSDSKAYQDNLDARKRVMELLLETSN